MADGFARTEARKAWTTGSTNLCRRAAAHYRAGSGGARRRARRAGAGRSRLSAGTRAHFRPCRLHRADHGRAAGRHHDHRGLRGRLAGAVAGPRRRRPDRGRLSAGDFVARASTGRWCGARISTAMPAMSPRWKCWRRSTAAGGFAASLVGTRRRLRAAAPHDDAAGGIRRSSAADRRHDGSEACSHRRAHRRIAAAEQA